ncbi:MAG: hypothetical protein SGBAC_011697, partial [Bacillariaceae sp.]
MDCLVRDRPWEGREERPPVTANDFLVDGGVDRPFKVSEGGPGLPNFSPVPPWSESDAKVDIDSGSLLSGETEGEKELSRDDKPSEIATDFLPRTAPGDAAKDSRLRNIAPGPSWDDTDDKPSGTSAATDFLPRNGPGDSEAEVFRKED